MFHPIWIPYDVKMLFNVVKLKPEYTIDDAELVMGEMCNLVKNTYRDAGGFVAGQVFKSAGFVSEEGTLNGATGNHGPLADELTKHHIVIITYWKSFELHELSHGDNMFRNKFAELKEMCEDTFEVGYDMLWQGTPE